MFRLHSKEMATSAVGNSKKGNFATEAKEVRKSGPAALQNDGFPAFVTYPFIHPFIRYLSRAYCAVGCAKAGGTVRSEFLTTETTNTEDQLAPLHRIPLS